MERRLLRIHGRRRSPAAAGGDFRDVRSFRPGSPFLIARGIGQVDSTISHPLYGGTTLWEREPSGNWKLELGAHPDRDENATADITWTDDERRQREAMRMFTTMTAIDALGRRLEW